MGGSANGGDPRPVGSGVSLTLLTFTKAGWRKESRRSAVPITQLLPPRFTTKSNRRFDFPRSPWLRRTILRPFMAMLSKESICRCKYVTSAAISSVDHPAVRKGTRKSLPCYACRQNFESKSTNTRSAAMILCNLGNLQIKIAGEFAQLKPRLGA